MAATKNAIYYAKIGGQYVELDFKSIASMIYGADGVSTVQDHLDDTVAHVTQAIQDQLTKLAADPNATYATKAEVAAAGGATVIVDDIPGRDAAVTAPAVLPVGQQVWVLDATGDSSVKSGAAEYIYGGNSSGSDVWYKVAETESMDVVVDWSSITNAPTSTAAEIDQAVADDHTHANTTVLDAIGDDGSGNLTYNGVVIGNVVVAADAPTTQADGGIWIQTL